MIKMIIIYFLCGFFLLGNVAENLSVFEDGSTNKEVPLVVHTVNTSINNESSDSRQGTSSNQLLSVGEGKTISPLSLSSTGNNSQSQQFLVSVVPLKVSEKHQDTFTLDFSTEKSDRIIYNHQVYITRMQTGNKTFTYDDKEFGSMSKSIQNDDESIMKDSPLNSNNITHKVFNRTISNERVTNEAENRNLTNRTEHNYKIFFNDNKKNITNYIPENPNIAALLSDSYENQIKYMPSIASSTGSTNSTALLNKLSNFLPNILTNQSDIENMIDDKNNTQKDLKKNEQLETHNQNTGIQKMNLYNSTSENTLFINKYEREPNNFGYLSDVSMEDDENNPFYHQNNISDKKKSNINTNDKDNERSENQIKPENQSKQKLETDEHLPLEYYNVMADGILNINNISEHTDCIEGKINYEHGHILDRECEEQCTCNHGRWICKPRCSVNQIKRGKVIPNQGCYEIATKDDCCSTIKCSEERNTSVTLLNDSKLSSSVTFSPIECHFNDVIYKFRERLEIGCDQICHCVSSGEMDCQPRCTIHNHTRVEKCVLVKDPKDVCCQLELCDVTLDDHEQPAAQTHSGVNGNSVLSIKTPQLGSTCFHKNVAYQIGQQFHDNCDALCLCTVSGLYCSKIECPSTFGLDVLDSHCLRWEPVPASFRAIVPTCCPERMRCADKGECLYKDQKFDNWSPIPFNLTGCEKHCYCENGKVECRPACPPVLALPPSNLPCHQSLARVQSIPGDECCRHWACVPIHNQKTNDFDNNNYQTGLRIITLNALDERTVRIVLTVPNVYVNLHGRIELRYTNNLTIEPSFWKTLTFAPPEDLIATSQLEFELPNLEPSSLYKIKAALILKDLNFQPTSEVYTVKTPNEQTNTPSPTILEYEKNLKDVLDNIENIQLSVLELNVTWLTVGWKQLPTNILDYIDGIRIRYKKIGAPQSKASALIHKTLLSYQILDLIPQSDYEVELYYIPLVGSGTEFKAGSAIKIHTLANVDAFAFNINVHLTSIQATLVEFNWTGVPYPEHKFIHIYRAIYQGDSEQENCSIYKALDLSKGIPNNFTIQNLKPGHKYRLWLEIYLTNGSIKKSNIVTFTTKSRNYNAQAENDVLLATSPIEQRINDYYGPLVVMSIVAAIAIMSTFVLLLILTRKRLHKSASISGRKDDAIFDNPSYKVELHQETMNL